jgi:hypothetical protein
VGTVFSRVAVDQVKDLAQKSPTVARTAYDEKVG